MQKHKTDNKHNDMDDLIGGDADDDACEHIVDSRPLVYDNMHAADAGTAHEQDQQANIANMSAELADIDRMVQRRFLVYRSEGVRWISDVANNVLAQAGVVGMERIEDLLTKWIVRPALFPMGYVRVLENTASNVGIVGRSGLGKRTAVTVLCKAYGITLLCIDTFFRNDIHNCLYYAARNTPCVVLFDKVERLFGQPGFAEEFAFEVRLARIPKVWYVFTGETMLHFVPNEAELFTSLVSLRQTANLNNRERHVRLGNAGGRDGDHEASTHMSLQQSIFAANFSASIAQSDGSSYSGAALASSRQQSSIVLALETLKSMPLRVMFGMCEEQTRDPTTAASLSSAKSTPYAASFGMSLIELVNDRIEVIGDVTQYQLATLILNNFLPKNCVYIDPPVTEAQQISLKDACMGATPSDAFYFATQVACNARARLSQLQMVSLYGDAQAQHVRADALYGAQSTSSATVSSAIGIDPVGSAQVKASWDMDISPLIRFVPSLSGDKSQPMDTQQKSICSLKMLYNQWYMSAILDRQQRQMCDTGLLGMPDVSATHGGMPTVRGTGAGYMGGGRRTSDNVYAQYISGMMTGTHT